MNCNEAIQEARDARVIDLCILRSGEVAWRIAHRWVLQNMRVDDVDDFLDSIGVKAESASDRLWNQVGYVVVDHSDPTGRQRVTLTSRRSAPVIVIRLHGAEAPEIESLNWPQAVTSWADRGQGVIVLTGPGGSGKTSLGSGMVRYCADRELTCWLLESPPEFDQPSPLAISYSVGPGQEFPSFAHGVVASMTATVDVVFLGQLNDARAAQAAFDAARFGKLVIVTMLSGSVTQALQQLQLWGVPGTTQAELLIGVAALRLVPASGGVDRLTGLPLIGASEVWEPTEDTLHFLRGEEYGEIHQLLRSNRSTLEHSLGALVGEQRVALTEARRLAPNPQEV